tara:strand:+ start:3909 stop:5024 length:1116 start_codon:yes stop_codon:yes gene_type:complete
MIILFYKKFNNYGGAEKFILNINKIIKKKYQSILITYYFDEIKFDRPGNLIKTSNLVSTLKFLKSIKKKNRNIKLISFSGFIDTYIICRFLNIKYNLVYFSPLSISHDEQTKFYFPLKSLFFEFIEKQNSHNIDKFYEKKTGLMNFFYYSAYCIFHYQAIINANYLITMSSYSSKEKKYLYKRNRIKTLSAALFNSEIRDNFHNDKQKNNKLLCISRLDKHKKIDELIINIKDVHMDYKLIIIGDGPEKDYLESIILNYGLSNKVELKGFINENEIDSFIQDCFCFISLDIGDFKISMFDALKFGKPVIINKFFVDKEMSLNKFIYFFDNNIGNILKQISETNIDKIDYKNLKFFLKNYSYESFTENLLKL